MISSEGCGRTGLICSPSAARLRLFSTTSPNAVAERGSGVARGRDEEEHQADQGEHLDQNEGHPGDAHELALRLRLTRGAVDDSGPDQTHTDTRADRAEAVTDEREARVDVDLRGFLGENNSCTHLLSLSFGPRTLADRGSRCADGLLLSARRPAPCRCSWPSAGRRCTPAGPSPAPRGMSSRWRTGTRPARSA